MSDEVRFVQSGPMAKPVNAFERIREMEAALAPFALWADSMYTLKDDDKVCGIYVRHFREAVKVLDRSTDIGGS